LDTTSVSGSVFCICTYVLTAAFCQQFIKEYDDDDDDDDVIAAVCCCICRID